MNCRTPSLRTISFARRPAGTQTARAKLSAGKSLGISGSAQFLESGKRSVRGVEPVELQAEVLQHGKVKVTERRRMPPLAGIVLVLAVLESTSDQNDGQVPVAMRICIAHSAPKQGHRVIQQRLPAGFLDFLELAKKAGELGDVKSLDDGEFGD